MPNDKSDRRPLIRLALFLACTVVILVGLSTLNSFTNTLHQLDVIEAERDQWQRPLEVLRELDVHDGSTVVDLGSGAGYFALKLSPAVGKGGQVLAVDLRRLSLFFLWTRARLRGQRNIHVIVGEERNPRLPTGSVNAVLICNTYHEFSDPERMLHQVSESLRPGGNVVVIDRSPGASKAGLTHEVPPNVVVGELRKQGFEIVRQDDHFIDRPGDDLWWLVVGRRP